jgi:hypothetical protein
LVALVSELARRTLTAGTTDSAGAAAGVSTDAWVFGSELVVSISAAAGCGVTISRFATRG